MFFGRALQVLPAGDHRPQVGNGGAAGGDQVEVGDKECSQEEGTGRMEHCDCLEAVHVQAKHFMSSGVPVEHIEQAGDHHHRDHQDLQGQVDQPLKRVQLAQHGLPGGVGRVAEDPEQADLAILPEDLDRTFAIAFQDREAAISAYADWFFEWKRSYVVLKETISSAITRIFETGKYESLNEAIEADVKDYFLRNYKEQVLKPELRDETITKGVEQAVRHAHDSYRRVIANGDMRLQLFLAKHTSHLEDRTDQFSATRRV